MMSEQNHITKLQNCLRLLDISQDLAATLSLEELLQRILTVAKELSDAEEASILLYDEAKKELFFQAATNTGVVEKLKGMSVPTESLAGWVALHRESIMVADVHHDERWFGKIGDAINFPTRSLIAIPLLAKDRLVGVLEVINKRQGNFNLEDQETLLVLGAQASVALVNARLFQQSDLISELVHELRTPLASINTIAYLLQRPNLTDAKRLELIKTIQRETGRLDEMAAAFLDLARMESGRTTFHMSLTELKPVLEECIQIFTPKAANHQIKIIADIPDNLPPISCDTAKIKQVFLNLLSNAVKYNHSGGTISISAWVDRHDIWVSVRDSGVGIPPEALPHLFEKFYRVPTNEFTAEGTGLGLSICKHIVECHSGKITVESLLGKETTFNVQLPRNLN